MLKFLIKISIIFSLFSPYAFGSSPAKAEGKNLSFNQKSQLTSKTSTIAICQFTSKNGRKSDQETALALSDLLFAELSVSPEIKIVERSKIDTILNELSYSLEQVNRPAYAAKIGQLAGADRIVVGTLIPSTNGPIIVVKVIDTHSGIIKDIISYRTKSVQTETTVTKLKESVLAACKDKTTRQKRQFIAIGSFEDQSINEKQINRGEYIRRFLEQKYDDTENISVVARSQLKPLLAEMGLNEMGLVTEKSHFDSAQPGFYIIDGSYSLYRKAETLIELSVNINNVSGGGESFRVESTSWDELMNLAWKKLNPAVVKTQGVSNADRFLESKKQFENGKERSGLIFRNRSRNGLPRMDTAGIGKTYDYQTKTFPSKEKRLKNVKDAIDHFESAIFLNPENYEAMLYLAYCLKYENIDEHKHAAELFQKVVSAANQDAFKYIAAKALGIVEQVQFTPQFSKKIVLTKDYAEKSSRELEQLQKKHSNWSTYTPSPSNVLKKILEAHRTSILANCEYLMWALKRKRLAQINPDLYATAHAMHVMAWGAEKNPHIANYIESLMDEVWAKYPRIAPHFLVAMGVYYPNSPNHILDFLPQLESRELLPFDPSSFYEKLGQFSGYCIRGDVPHSLEAGKKIGEHMLKMGKLGPEETIYLAFSYEMLGDIETGANLLAQLKSSRITLSNEKPWSTKTTSHIPEILFSPKDTRIKWLQRIGKAAGTEDEEQIFLKEAVVGLPTGSWISTLTVDQDTVWICSATDIYKYNKNSRKLVPIQKPFPIKSEITSIVARGNMLWIGTQNGLFELNYKTQKYQRFGLDEGLLKPHILSLCLKRAKLYVTLKSGLGYLALNSPKHHFYGLLTNNDVRMVTHSGKGVWALQKDRLMHIDYETDTIVTEVKFPENDLYCLAANNTHVVIGINDPLYQRGPEDNPEKLGGAIVYQPESKNIQRIYGSSNFVDQNVFTLALTKKKQLVLGGKGYLAIMGIAENAMIRQLKREQTNFRIISLDNDGLWLAAGRQLHYLSTSNVTPIKPQTIARDSEPSNDETTLDATILNTVRYDGTQASLRKIQTSVLPAVNNGNIIAINIYRQTMFGLGQDMGLQRITTYRSHPQESGIIDKWVSGVKKKADTDDPFFKTVMGLLYFHGVGVKKNDQECLRYLNDAADNEYHDAYLKIGILYNLGLLHNKDLAKAAGYYKKAGQLGSAIGLYNLGCMYNKGEGVQADQEKAVVYWKKSAAMGHANSQFNLGLAYMNGNGITHNEREGNLWIKKAAAQGHNRAKSY